MPRLILLGVGTARSRAHAPAGLLVEYGHAHVGLDGGPGSEPPETCEAWLVRDEKGPLQAELLRIARESGMPAPVLAPYRHGSLHIVPMPVPSRAGTMHGYRIAAGRRTCVWAPESAEPPAWARGADLVFAGAGRAPAATAEAFRGLGVRRLVLVRSPGGDAEPGGPPPFGEWGAEGAVYRM
ncbi:hypothetical protein [Actinomadura fibrosa]|uniref:Uncharacterized protein n=1 Tax=Actinomadura fibrosa TaxID=111802 RepID=A0ABW2XUA4_9ACTN|nr:hypothetical protein [Actinomadura fibrosa]